jgi:hypothetical protein
MGIEKQAIDYRHIIGQLDANGLREYIVSHFINADNPGRRTLADILFQLIALIGSGGSPTTVSVTYIGDTLTVDINGVVDTVTITIPPDQTLSLVDNDLSISAGNTVQLLASNINLNGNLTVLGTNFTSSNTVWDVLQVLNGLSAGSGGGYLKYQNGGARITASDLTVTFASSPGIKTITVPTGVNLASVKFFGDSSVLDGNNGLTINVNWVDDRSFTVSSGGNSDFDLPNFQVLNMTSVLGGGPSSILPFEYGEAAAPNKRLIGYTTKTLQFYIDNLNNFAEWGVVLNWA